MKKIILSLLFLYAFTLYAQNDVLQQNINGLKFSKAIFISGSAEVMDNHIVFDIPITIEKGKVWNITSSQSFMVKRKYKLYRVKLSFWINDQPIYYYKGDINGSSIWLPEGKYRFMLKSRNDYSEKKYLLYLSGVEYTIQK